MRVVVVGAQGTIGRALIEGLATAPLVGEVISLVGADADLVPLTAPPGIDQHVVDLSADLTTFFRYADAVVCAGWIAGEASRARSGSRQLTVLRRTCADTAAAEVRIFVHFSSAATYAPAPPGQLVDESWPTRAETDSLQWLNPMLRGEHFVEQFEKQHPIIRVVRLRVPLIVRPPDEAHWAECSSWRRFLARLK